MYSKKDQDLLAEAYLKLKEMNLGPAGEGIQPVGKPVIVTMDMPLAGAEDCEEGSDGEIEMALAELHKLTDYAPKLAQIVSNMDSLEGWVAAKLTKAADYISSVYHWLEYKSHDSISTGDMFQSGYENTGSCEYAARGCKCRECSECL